MERAVSIFALFALLGGFELMGQTLAGAAAQAAAVASGAAAGASTGAIAIPVVGIPATPTTAPPVSSNTRLVNLSTRARVGAGGMLVTGFAIRGTAPRTILIRAVGPGLTSFGVAGALSAPGLQLRAAGGALVVENSGWGNSVALANAFATVGAFPFAPGSADSAAVVTLAPGNFTVEVRDAAGGNGGVVLAEIYDLGGTADDSRLVNGSSRAIVTADGGELISGFVLAGTGLRRFLLRGVGPGLSRYGINDVLINPTLAVFDSSGVNLATNYDWSGGVESANAAAVAAATAAFPDRLGKTPEENAASVNVASAATGAFALDLYSKDSALVVVLAPGAYTAQVTGTRNVISTVTPIPPSTGADGAAQASGVIISLTITPAAPGAAMLEIYALPE